MSQRSRKKHDQHRRRQRAGVQLAAAVGAVVLLIVIGVLALGSVGSDGDSTEGRGGLTVSMTEFAFAPDPIVLPQGDAVLTIVNDGTIAHNLLINDLGKGAPDLDPGQEFELDLTDQPPGTYAVICDLPDHAAAGMVTTLTIE